MSFLKEIQLSILVFIFIFFPTFAGSSRFLFCVCFDLFHSWRLSLNVWYSLAVQSYSRMRNGKSQLVGFHSRVIWQGTDLSIEVFSRGFTFSRNGFSEIPAAGGAGGLGNRSDYQYSWSRWGWWGLRVLLLLYTLLQNCAVSPDLQHILFHSFSDLCLILNFGSISCLRSQTS